MTHKLCVKKKDGYLRLPLVLAKNSVIFPDAVLPLYVNGKDHKQSCGLTSEEDRVFVVSSENLEGYVVGTVCHVLRKKQVANEKVKVILQGVERAKVVRSYRDEGLQLVDVASVHDDSQSNNELLYKNYIESIKKSLNTLRMMGKILSPRLVHIIDNKIFSQNIDALILSHIHLSPVEQQSILELRSRELRLERINNYLCQEIEILFEQERIKHQTNKVFSIYKATSDKTDNTPLSQKNLPPESKFLKLIESAPLLLEHKDFLLQQVDRLNYLSKDSVEYQNLSSYLENIAKIPWNSFSSPSENFAEVKEKLNQDHYGLEDVKQRILEYLALRKLNPENKGMILCLVGPPGVGKTSIGESIANALHRPFVRISLGGVKEEADIRGHRRTYVGSYPGRFIQALQQAKTMDPVIMLDEIDKIAENQKSAPSAALLEILDPKQNHNFTDHYMNLPCDFSNVMFVANANSVERMNPQLLDRLEVINLSGYSELEKEKIAKERLFPKIIKESGLGSYRFNFEKDFFSFVIQSYTRESGLRSLERVLKTICRKLALTVVQKKVQPKGVLSLSKKRVEKFLGTPLWEKNNLLAKHGEVGTCFALAYTGEGGAVLNIETKISEGSGMILTGNLGPVMKESAQTAYSYLKSSYERFGLSSARLSNKEIHMHMPYGACFKEGPSAGLPILCSMISALTNKPLKSLIAMTGEITLGGQVLGIGGLREKILAASREGFEMIVVPSANLPEFNGFSSDIRKALTVRFVNDFNEVLPIIFR